MPDQPVPNGDTPGDDNEIRQALVALNLVHGDRGLICALAQRLGTASQLHDDRFAEDASSSLEAPLGRVRSTLLAARGRLDDARAEMVRAREAGVDIVTLSCREYPPPLADLGLQAPPVLYVRGRLSPAPGISIVGSRKADAYGLEVASWFARRLAAAGLVVISGFARGIDQAAHRSALAGRAGTGRTTAVLGCGVDVDYPRNSRRIAAEIARNGCLVSEFPLGRQAPSSPLPDPQSAHRRSRLRFARGPRRPPLGLPDHGPPCPRPRARRLRRPGFRPRAGVGRRPPAPARRRDSRPRPGRDARNPAHVRADPTRSSCTRGGQAGCISRRRPRIRGR